MRRHTISRVALLMITLTCLSGCHPTQPFYFHEDGDLSHYLDQAMDIEYADVDTAPMPDAAASLAPLTVTDGEFENAWDLKLEECIHISLQNSKTIRNLGGVTPFGFADGLVGRTAGSATVYDPAITETNPGSVHGEFSTGPLNSALRAASVGGVEAALADYDAQFSMTGTAPGGEASSLFSRTDRPQLIGLAGSFNDTANGGLETRLFKRSASGARFSFNNETSYNRFNRGNFGAVNSTWSTEFQARIDYPLLRGRGTQINRLPVVLARINTDISQATFEASVRNLVLDIENTYWDLNLAYRMVETAKIARDSALATHKKISAELFFGKEAVQPEAQAREQYFRFRAALEQQLQQLFNTESRLRWLMGLAATDGRLIRPIDEPTMARVEFDWCSVRTEALVRATELRQKKWQVKQRELELISAKNQLLPQLDVGAYYRWVGVGDELVEASRTDARFPDPGSTAFQELTSGDYQEAGIAFNFFMPVGFRRQLAGVRNAQLSLAREKAQLEDMELNQVHLLSTAVRDMDANYVQAQSHFNRLSASEKEVAALSAVFKGGMATVDLVLEAQRRRAEAQSEFYRTLAEYSKKIAEVHFRKGSLLEYNNIQLAEGAWPHKAYWDALGRARERDASYFLNYGWTRPNVVSQGPVPQLEGQAGGMQVGPQGTPTPAEIIPAPEPTQADPEAAPAPPAGIDNGGFPDPAVDPNPALPKSVPDAGPITELPGLPMLNAPVIRASAEQPIRSERMTNPLRNQPFDWSDVGLGSDRAPGNNQKPTNSLRIEG